MKQASQLPTVCHVLLSLQVGGAEVLARQFAQSLNRQYRPVFACLDSLGPIGGALQAQGVPVRVLDRQPGFDPRCVGNLRRFLIEQDVRLIHAHQYTPFFYASLARIATGRIPVLFTEHGRHHPDQRRTRRVWANRLLVRARDRVVAVSEHVRQALIANEGIAPGRVAVIQNGVCEDVFRANAATRCEVRRELGVAETDQLVVQVARLNRLKDHATALRAIALLRQSRPGLQLLLVGDGELRDELQNMAVSLQLESCVRFLGARDDVPRLLQAADVFLLSSIAEGIPLTLIEAMLSGVPAVATRVGGVPEVIEDGRDGLLATPGDAASVAGRLRRLLDDDALRRRLARAGLERARLMFGAGTMIAKYERVYGEMLRARPFGANQQGGATHRVPELAVPAPLNMSGGEIV